MLIKAIATGRKWGDKRNPVEKTVVVEGVKLRLIEADTWSSGDENSLNRSCYVRTTMLEMPSPVDAWPNLSALESHHD